MADDIPPQMGDNFTSSKTTITDKEVLEHNGDEICGEPNKKHRTRLRVLWPNRKIIIEPAFALFYAFHISSLSLTSQYTYYAIGERYNLSAYNMGQNSSSEEECKTGVGAQRNSTYYHLQQKAQAETARFNMYIDLMTEIPGLFVMMFMGKCIHNEFKIISCINK